MALAWLGYAERNTNMASGEARRPCCASATWRAGCQQSCQLMSCHFFHKPLVCFDAPEFSQSSSVAMLYLYIGSSSILFSKLSLKCHRVEAETCNLSIQSHDVQRAEAWSSEVLDIAAVEAHTKQIISRNVVGVVGVLERKTMMQRRY